jgi:hypothetical protein
MAEPVSSLWIGPALGILERLAITSFLRQGHEYHLYCYDEIANIPAGTIVKDANAVLPASRIFCYQRGPGKGSVAAFANLFRYKLLLENGGWWVDADIVCLKPFDFPDPMVFASEQLTVSSSQTANAVLRLPAGHIVARHCYELADRREPRTLNWGDTGPRLLHQVVTTHGLTPLVKEIGAFCPLPWWDWRLALDADAGMSLALYESSWAIHLWREKWRRAGIEGQTEFPANSLLSQLLKKYPVE